MRILERGVSEGISMITVRNALSTPYFERISTS